MPSAHEIAVALLDRFAENVVAKRGPYSYGHYAAAIGKNPREYGLAIGQAMHAIGALCVIRQVPVAPLFWVERTDGGERGIFESDPIERARIIDTKDFDVMSVVAREHVYTREEFAGISAAMQKSLASGNLGRWSPHAIWHLTFRKKPTGEDITYYDRAMRRYREIFAELSAARAKK